MAYFPRTFYQTEGTSFTPLFRLLDDFDTYSRQSKSKCSRRQCALPQWQPKFDLRETADAYELYGELPGVSKDTVNIEFTEPQTIHVRGKAERTYHVDSSQTGPVENTLLANGGSTEYESSNKARKATVEDEDDEEWTHTEHSAPPTPTTSGEEIAKPKEEKKTGDQAKYWLLERNIGEFARSFTFPNRIDEDKVSAKFQDGILKITVPKAKKHEARRVVIG